MDAISKKHDLIGIDISIPVLVQKTIEVIKKAIGVLSCLDETVAPCHFCQAECLEVSIYFSCRIYSIYFICFTDIFCSHFLALLSCFPALKSI